MRQADLYDKTGEATKGGRGLKNLASPKHLEINFYYL